MLETNRKLDLLCCVSEKLALTGPQPTTPYPECFASRDPVYQYIRVTSIVTDYLRTISGHLLHLPVLRYPVQLGAIAGWCWVGGRSQTVLRGLDEHAEELVAGDRGQ